MQNNRERMNETKKEVSDSHEEPHFRAFRGGKMPPRVTIETGVLKTSFPWRLSAPATFDGNTVTIHFTTHVVAISGRNLGELFDYVTREKVEIIRETGDVDEIDITERQE